MVSVKVLLNAFKSIAMCGCLRLRDRAGSGQMKKRRHRRMEEALKTREIDVRSPTRQQHGAIAVLTAGLFLVAGCGGDGDKETGAGAGAAARDSREVLLQPLAAQGPDPFTASTATGTAPVTYRPPSGVPGTPPSAGAVQQVRTVSGATPGLYGGTRGRPSCDIERQVNLLTADPGKERAFARAAGVGQAGVANWLRGLTPVLLRTDTRVTSHGYRDGSAAVLQSVLQSGTAVLVDQYGAPRVRCAGGNPLRSPATVEGEAAHTGESWAGYRRDQVVVINATQRILGSLIIADVVDNTWIERRTGAAASQDRRPDTPPPYSPNERSVIDQPVPDAPAGPRSTVPAPPGDAPGAGLPPAPGDGAAAPDGGAVPDGGAIADGGEAVPRDGAVPDGGEAVPDGGDTGMVDGEPDAPMDPAPTDCTTGSSDPFGTDGAPGEGQEMPSGCLTGPGEEFLSEADPGSGGDEGLDDPSGDPGAFEG
ncbi:DUF6777 domain-containing protein [Streptomyces sp. SP18CS02]|uniref:DUF6777 domain-containing protein n=1 Tax=Streptomyces sp. SP18CS02 TaxID=3002531 RepID=UPI002E75A6EF|nr:DUF6777 domain-containing protein [Streptomyces sp. SP18CS02]MEE1754505.1 hypothetical protein [Streptomyces sp. SP18CS02]